MNSGLYSFALVMHLMGGFLFIAGMVLAGVGFEAGRRRSQPGEVALLLWLARIGVLMLVAGTLLVLGFGLWLVHLGGWGYGTGWVSASLGLFFVALALGEVGGRPLKRARLTAAELAQRGEPLSDEVRELLGDRKLLVANYISLALMIAIIVLMVVKP